MTITLRTIPSPTIGSDAHSVSSLTQMLAAITANMNTLKSAIEAQETALAAKALEYLQEDVPDEARVGDKWYKTDAPDLADVTVVEGWICKIAYLITDGLTTEQKEAKWRPASDKSSIDTVASLTSLLDGKASVIQSDEPPAAMDAGDIWIDINLVSGINQVYAAINDYDYSGTGGAPGAGWTTTEIGNHFRISGDKSAQAAAADADAVARSKTVNYLRTDMPGISGADQTAQLSFEIGDSWTEDVAPYQSYVCYLGYDYTDVPADSGDRITFLAAHWRAKGDKTAQDAATAAAALADGKITNYRQLTVPAQGDVLDSWFKNYAGVDRDELYSCNATYTAAQTSADYISEGYATVEEYRETFWDPIYDKSALEAADAAAATANGKTADWYTNNPPSAAGASDRWMDRDASPIGQYTSLGAYDYSEKNSVTWVTTGATDDTGADVILLVSDFWAKVSQEDEVTSLTDLANKANSYIDGSKSTYMSLNPPVSSGITYVSGGIVVERPIGVGDTWVKTDLQLVSTAADLSTWHCFREYDEVTGITLTGYTGPDRDGSNNLLAPGDVGFQDMNGYNYWVAAADPTALEAAIDIIALKDGKRSTFITDSTEGANGIPQLKAALGGIQLGDIWIDEGDSFKVFKCKVAYSSDLGTFQGVSIPVYVDKATNWLEVSEPELTAQAVFRRGLITSAQSDATSALTGGANDSAARASAATGISNAATVAGDLATHEGLSAGVHGASGTLVGTTDTQTLTNKTLGTGTVIDVDNATLTNIETDNLKASAIATAISGSPVDTKLATEKAVADKFTAVAATVEEFGVYLEDRQTDTAKAGWTSALIGTRIDVTDPSYATSTFKFEFDALIKPPEGQTYSEYTFRIRGKISKLSGGEPFVALFCDNDAGINGSVSHDSDLLLGSLPSTASTKSLILDTANFPNFASAINIERVDSSDELCFRLNITFVTTQTAFDFLATMNGPRKYTGTLISSSNGTEF